MKQSALQFLLKNKNKELLLQVIYKKINKKEELNIKTISQESYQSISSITRFFSKNNFEGFKEFKYLLLSEMQEIQTLKNEDEIRIFEKEYIFDNINKTYSLNDQNIFQLAIEMMKEAKKNIILAIGGNHAIAYELKTRLQRLGINCEHNLDYHDMNTSVSNADENTLVWVFSYSGQTPEIISLVEKAKIRNAKIISFTRNSNSKLRKISNLNFLIDDSEILTRLFSIKSRFAMMYLVQKLSYEIYLSDTEKYYSLLENSLYKI